MIFEARTRSNKGCANVGNLEWRMKSSRRNKHGDQSTGAVGSGGDGGGKTSRSHLVLSRRRRRSRRDVTVATKYIETALVIDKAMFDKRNGSSRADIVHDVIQVANIADLYFKTLNTRVSVVYVETWQGGNQAQLPRNEDISRSLLNFNDYTSRKLFTVDKDTSQLLTGETFAGGEAGMAVPDTVCTQKAVGISVDINTYEPHLLAGTMAHMIGHNLGMGHDDGREECYCRDWHGCIMAQSIVGQENVQPYKFSECSRKDYADSLRIGHGICLMNRPNQVTGHQRNCGNRIVEEGEDCDCGTIDECQEIDPCCDPITCKLTKDSECASGPCCDNCHLRHRGVVCRDATNECDLPEYCTGDVGLCPDDVHKKNGNRCASNTGYCFNGQCPTLNAQCEQIWGRGGVAADARCYDQFNSKGSMSGHCGTTGTPGHFLKCAPENVRCGSLQCQMGNKVPVIDGMDDMFARTIFSIKSVEYECKATSGSVSSALIPPDGLVRDGTPCGDDLVCVNQTCTSIFPYVDQSRCPSNHANLECSGRGYCTNTNRCWCEPGWTASDCSQEEEYTTPPPTTASAAPAPSQAKEDINKYMTKNVTPYGEYRGARAAAETWEERVTATSRQVTPHHDTPEAPPPSLTHTHKNTTDRPTDRTTPLSLNDLVPRRGEHRQPEHPVHGVYHGGRGEGRLHLFRVNGRLLQVPSVSWLLNVDRSTPQAPLTVSCNILSVCLRVHVHVPVLVPRVLHCSVARACVPLYLYVHTCVHMHTYVHLCTLYLVSRVVLYMIWYLVVSVCCTVYASVRPSVRPPPLGQTFVRSTSHSASLAVGGAGGRRRLTSRPTALSLSLSLSSSLYLSLSLCLSMSVCLSIYLSLSVRLHVPSPVPLAAPRRSSPHLSTPIHARLSCPLQPTNHTSDNR